MVSQPDPYIGRHRYTKELKKLDRQIKRVKKEMEKVASARRRG